MDPEYGDKSSDRAADVPRYALVSSNGAGCCRNDLRVGRSGRCMILICIVPTIPTDDVNV